MAAREEKTDLVGGCKRGGASASFAFLSFLGLAVRNPRVSCSWGVEKSWREREKRERDLGEIVSCIFLA